MSPTPSDSTRPVPDDAATHRPAPPPLPDDSTSVAGEEDPGAALETLVEPAPATPEPPSRRTPGRG